MISPKSASEMIWQISCLIMLILWIWTKCDLQHWTGVDQGLTQRHWPLRWNHAFLFTKIDKKRRPLPINGMKVKMVANNVNEGYETRVDSRFPQSWDQHFGRWDQRQLFPAKLRWKKPTKKFTLKINCHQVDVTASKGEVSQSWSRWSWPRSSRVRR